MTHLVWFRNDLRTADNAALTAACQSDQPVIACFVLAQEQWRMHDWSPARIRLVIDHANALAEALAKLGIAMHFLEAQRFDDSQDALIRLCHDQSVTTVHFNEEYGVNERRRDKQLAQRLGDTDITVHKYRDQCAVPVGRVLTGQNQPYSVFTPFSRTWRRWLDDQQPTLYPQPAAKGDPVTPSRIDPTTIAGYDQAPPPLVATGEAAAHDRLEEFLADPVAHYKQQRDFPAKDATSLLSPYLASGILSGRQCWAAAQQVPATAANQEGLACWVNEIAWRDFYIHILYHFPRVSMNRAFKPETEALDWNPSTEHFEAWKEGRTGVPIVDAAMRQLNQTGWMHNRLRMITAMYLSKNLFIDWRLGEAYFMTQLVDGFLASNNGGWQWSASTGTDAAPYFRIFNPVTQGERFDPNGDFIRRYVPELAALDGDAVHQPWRSGKLPKGYPRQLVDLKESRKEAIARFQALKEENQVAAD